jgi:hypothetical protein
VSTVQEIEAAIRKLSSSEREQLITDLPKLLPELNGDAAWEQLIRDDRPRAALSALLDSSEAQFRKAPKTFPETCDTEFDRR